MKKALIEHKIIRPTYRNVEGKYIQPESSVVLRESEKEYESVADAVADLKYGNCRIVGLIDRVEHLPMYLLDNGEVHYEPIQMRKDQWDPPVTRHIEPIQWNHDNAIRVMNKDKYMKDNNK